ncbi:hypothetical protein AM586_28275 [Massilia sp. WG5]|nr:hypothetical protein AM586_28275 [Massilia sp. WG5]
MKQINPFNYMDKVTRANIYAKFLMEGVTKDALLECFGDDFCEAMSGLISFSLFETKRSLSDVSSIRFYDCDSGRGKKTMITRIKFK